MEYQTEELYEMLAGSPIFLLMGYGSLEKFLNKDRISEIICLCSNSVNAERKKKGGRFKIDKTIREILNRTKDNLKVQLDDIVEDLEQERETVFPHTYYKLMRDV